MFKFFFAAVVAATVSAVGLQAHSTTDSEVQSQTDAEWNFLNPGKQMRINYEQARKKDW